MFRFIYWNAIPISLGAIVFYYLNKIDDIYEYLRMVINVLGLAIPFLIIHIWIGNKIFPEKMTLADKIMGCKLRVQYGGSYCVKCPDSYVCASDIE